MAMPRPSTLMRDVHPVRYHATLRCPLSARQRDARCHAFRLLLPCVTIIIAALFAILTHRRPARHAIIIISALTLLLILTYY